MLAPIAALCVWMLIDLARTGKATAIGAATAIVVGLVAVTPAAGFVSPASAIFIGAIAAFPSYFALLWRARTRLDDSLDVLSAHGAGEIAGARLTGVFAQKAWSGGANGLLFGNPKQLLIQAAAVALIGEGGVGETVAEHGPAGGQGRGDDLLHMLGASRSVEEELGERDHGPVAGVQEDGPHLVGDGAPPGFAGEENGVSRSLQSLGQESDLGGLAASFDPLKGYEQACHGSPCPVKLKV